MIIHELQTCTSTNDLALNSSGQDGETWISLEQTQGRGRRHGSTRRSWYSPADAGVYFSILLRPNCKPAKISGLTLVVGAALCDVLSEYGLEPWLKWPNDVFIGKEKLAGILTEASTIDGLLDRVVIGVGINVNLEEDRIPEDLRGRLTAISLQSGETFDRIELAKQVRLKILEKSQFFLKEGFDALYDYIKRFDESAGLRVETKGSLGKAIGITRSGSLAIENEEGCLEVNAGEVVFLFD